MNCNEIVENRIFLMENRENKSESFQFRGKLLKVDGSFWSDYSWISKELFEIAFCEAEGTRCAEMIFMKVI